MSWGRFQYHWQIAEERIIHDASKCWHSQFATTNILMTVKMTTKGTCVCKQCKHYPLQRSINVQQSLRPLLASSPVIHFMSAAVASHQLSALYSSWSYSLCYSVNDKAFGCREMFLFSHRMYSARPMAWKSSVQGYNAADFIGIALFLLWASVSSFHN